MLVTHQEDHITHAVIGGNEAISMGVSDDAALMHILSASLYSHPELACARETICNAWDAHLESGKAETPIEITLSGNTLVIKDFGLGIAHDMIGQIYGTYGNSTKRDRSESTGGFGLGSKSPFAICDTFEVVSSHQGQKSIYRVSKSSMEKGGKPAIHPVVVGLPTEESGITVTIVFDPAIFAKVENAVDCVLRMGEINCLYNGKAVATVPISKSPTGYVLTNFVTPVTARINIRYGAVVYPVLKRDEYAEDFDRILRDMNRLRDQFNIIFMAPPDTISVAPSREALQYTDGTVATITELLANFEIDPNDKVKDSTLEMVRAYVKKAIKKWDTAMLERQVERATNALGSVDATLFGFTEEIEGTHCSYGFNSKAIFRMAWVGNRHSSSLLPESILKSYILDELMRRYKAARNGVMIKLLGDWRKVFLKEQHRAFDWMYNRYHRDDNNYTHLLSKHFLMPVYQALDAHPLLHRANLFRLRDSWGDKFVAFNKPRMVSFDDVNQINMKIVVITNAASRGCRYIRENRDLRSIHDNVMVYATGSKLEHQVEAVDVFQKLGYTIFEAFPEPKVKAVKEVDPNGVPVPPKPRAKARKGYLSLNDAYCPHENGSDQPGYLLAEARERVKPGEETLVEPKAYTTLYSRNQRNQVIPGFTEAASKLIHQLFGDKIAVITPAQEDAMIKKGAVNLTKFITDELNVQLAQAEGVHRYIAVVEQLQRTSRYNGYPLHRFVYAISQNKELSDLAGLRIYVPPMTHMLVQLASDALSDAVPVLQKMREVVKRNDLTQDFRQKLSESGIEDIVVLDELAKRMSESDVTEERAAMVDALAKFIIKEVTDK